MDIEEMIEINKMIRTYKGDNPFIISLKKQLKTNKYLERVEVGKRKIKILSDRQYKTALPILNS